MDEPQRDVMDAEAAARYLNVGIRVIYRLADSGQIPGRKIGKEWRFSRRALERHLDHLGRPEDTED